MMSLLGNSLKKLAIRQNFAVSYGKSTSYVSGCDFCIFLKCTKIYTHNNPVSVLDLRALPLEHTVVG